MSSAVPNDDDGGGGGGRGAGEEYTAGGLTPPLSPTKVEGIDMDSGRSCPEDGRQDERGSIANDAGGKDDAEGAERADREDSSDDDNDDADEEEEEVAEVEEEAAEEEDEEEEEEEDEEADCCVDASNLKPRCASSVVMRWSSMMCSVSKLRQRSTRARINFPVRVWRAANSAVCCGALSWMCLAMPAWDGMIRSLQPGSWQRPLANSRSEHEFSCDRIALGASRSEHSLQRTTAPEHASRWVTTWCAPPTNGQKVHCTW